MARATRRNEPKAKVLQDDVLMLFGVVGDDWMGFTAAEVVEDLHSVDSDPVKVLINSPGGFVTDGLAIYNQLVSHPSAVEVEIVGVAASAASFIAMAGDTVKMSANALLMIHDPWLVKVGNAEQLRRAAEMLDKFGTSLVDIYTRKTGLDEAEIRELMAANDGDGTWFNAEEALEQGFIDEVVEGADPEAFAQLDIGELGTVPAALTRLIREGRQMAKKQNGGDPKEPVKQAEPTAAADPKPEPTGAEPEPAVQAQATATPQSQDVDERIEAVLAAERKRGAGIRAIAAKLGLEPAWAEARISDGTTVDVARAAAIDAVVARQETEGGPQGFAGSGLTVGTDEHDKFVDGASAWLVQKAGRSQLVEKHTGKALEPGEFRGMSLLDLARESLSRQGLSTRGLGKMEIAGMALGRGPRASANAGLGTRSDFPVLLENALHKMLMAAYQTTPDTWSNFAAIGSVSDFRPHPRLRLGSFGALDDLLESGEFRQKHFPDAAKESISAGTKGNIVGLTRQAIVNDDVDGFSRLITMLGRAARLSIEVDVYALLAENGGLGPVMGDGNTLFHADHGNIGDGAALTAAAIDADRVLMGSQMDPSGNEYLDLRPAVLLVALALGSTARAINSAQYDPDNVGSLRPNTVNGLFSTIVDTARISGTRRYLFADPAIAPVIEVVYLDGQAAPVLETEEGFDYDGIRWRVRHDYGVGATDYRGALTDAGA